MIDVYFIGGPANGRHMQIDEKHSRTFIVPVAWQNFGFVVGNHERPAFDSVEYKLLSVRDRDGERRWVAVSDFGKLDELIRLRVVSLEH